MLRRLLDRLLPRRPPATTPAESQAAERRLGDIERRVQRLGVRLDLHMDKKKHP